MGGMYGGIIGGTVQHLSEYAGEAGPAATTQRKMSRRAEQKLISGDFGMSNAQKQDQFAQAQKMFAGQGDQMRADLARQRAAGNLSGGAYTEAVRAASQQQGAAGAQVQANIQAASDRQAQYDYANAVNTVDKQADRWRKQMAKQGEISWKAANESTNMAGMMGSGGGGGNNDLINSFKK